MSSPQAHLLPTQLQRPQLPLLQLRTKCLCFFCCCCFLTSSPLTPAAILALVSSLAGPDWPTQKSLLPRTGCVLLTAYLLDC